MRKVIFLVGLILVTGITFVCGEQIGNPQDVDVDSKEVHTDKIKTFVDGFETYAKKILDDYKKEIEGIDAKHKVEKHNKMLNKIGNYFAGKEFSLKEWLLIQQEFDRRYKASEADYDQLGSEMTYSMVRQYSEKTAAPDFNNLLAIISDKNYDQELRTKYVSYITTLIHQISYYPNEKYKSIDNETRNRIADVLIVIINEKTNDFTLRKESSYLLAGYFGEDEKAADIILNILNDPMENKEIKSRIIFGAGIKFGVAKDKRIMKKLTDILKDRSSYPSDIINGTMRTLCHLNNKDAINAGIEILNTTDDKNLFKATVSSLCVTNDKEAIKAVLKNNSKFGIKTVRFIVRNDDVLIDIMNNEPEEYTLPAIEALGVNLNKDPRNVVTQLESKVYDAKPEIRLVSIHAIAKIGERGDTDVETKNKTLSILNKSKSIEKDQEVLSEIEDSIRILEGRP